MAALLARPIIETVSVEARAPNGESPEWQGPCAWGRARRTHPAGKSYSKVGAVAPAALLGFLTAHSPNAAMIA